MGIAARAGSGCHTQWGCDPARVLLSAIAIRVGLFQSNHNAGLEFSQGVSHGY